jgi:hypothetical protein
MGFSYLGGEYWSQVTRDERFFCQRLFELVRSESEEAFVRYISKTLGLNLQIDGEWEIGFEVCFYRDLWQHRERKCRLYSPKRTFDLCLFGDRAIVIIEAKAAGGFDKDQNAVFERDVARVQKLTGVEQVLLIGFCSSQCDVEPALAATFKHKILRWNDLAAHFGGDAILSRADEVYEHQEAFASMGCNSDNRMSGSELLEAFHNGADWWVGRGGGATGERFRKDIRTGRWRDQIYEVNTKSTKPPSSNYFRIKEFVQAVAPGGLDKYRTK